MKIQYFIDSIDPLSSLLTIGFGIFSITRDTKPKDGKLTKAGKIAIFGIILIGCFSFIVKTGNLYTKHLQQEKQQELNAITEQKKQSEDAANSLFQNKTDSSLDRIQHPLFPLCITTTFIMDASGLDHFWDYMTRLKKNQDNGLPPQLTLNDYLSYRSYDLKMFNKLNKLLSVKLQCSINRAPLKVNEGIDFNYTVRDGMIDFKKFNIELDFKNRWLSVLLEETYQKPSFGSDYYWKGERDLTHAGMTISVSGNAPIQLESANIDHGSVVNGSLYGICLYDHHLIKEASIPWQNSYHVIIHDNNHQDEAMAICVFLHSIRRSGWKEL